MTWGNGNKGFVSLGVSLLSRVALRVCNFYCRLTAVDPSGKLEMLCLLVSYARKLQIYKS